MNKPLTPAVVLGAILKARGKQVIDKLPFDVSPVFVINWYHLVEIGVRFVVNQGGMRSGKTYSILQCILLYCLQNNGKIVDIFRKFHAELEETVVQDFDDIIEKAGLTHLVKKNKKKLTYKINGNTVRFLGIDKAQKKRGSKRDLCYINEANGLTLDDFIQINGRLTGKMFIDYNPSEAFWINAQILDRPNTGKNQYRYIQSTYLDNWDYLPEEQRLEIERLIDVDDFYYQVYVLGNFAIMKGKIYDKTLLVEPDLYDMLQVDEIYYGLDFGYVHATSLIEIKYAQEKTYERERIHSQKLYDTDLIEEMERLGISKTAPIYADPAYPSAIDRLRDAGYNVYKAKKDVDDGIRYMQTLKPFVCKSSVNLLKERNLYKWRQRADGTIIEGEPVKRDDDACDAERYGNYSHRKRLAA